MRYRPVDTVGAEHVGRRVTIRRRLDGGAATDVVGILEEADEAALTVRDRNGDRHTIGRTEVVAARVVGPAPRLENPANPGPG